MMFTHKTEKGCAYMTRILSLISINQEIENLRNISACLTIPKRFSNSLILDDKKITS